MAPLSKAVLQSMKITEAQGEQVRAIWKLLQDDEATGRQTVGMNM